ncbi:MAG: phage distal tail protein, partial [Clostridia bacterium]
VSGAVTLTCNGHTLKVPGNCTVDCEHQLVTYGGESLMSSVSGTFFELAPGENVLTLSKTAAIEISYEPRYLHDADLSEVDWNE